MEVKTIQLERDGIHLNAQFVGDGIIRLRCNPDGDFTERETFVAQGPMPATGARLTRDGGQIVLERGDLRFTVDAGTLAVQLERDGKLCFSSVGESPFTMENGRIRGVFTLLETERVYGLGMANVQRLDLRGKLRELWDQRDTRRYCASTPSPFYYSTNGYALLLNSPWPSRFVFDEGERIPKNERLQPEPPWGYDAAVPEAERGRLTLLPWQDRLDIFVVSAPTFPQAIEAFDRLTGSVPMIPRWALGLQMSKFGYMNQGELIDTAVRLRREGIPCDALILDVVTYQYLGDLRLEKQNWPDPQGLVRVLNAMGIQLMGGQHPYVDENSLWFDEFQQKGYLTTLREGLDLKNAGNAGMVAAYRYAFDFTNPEARAAWWDKTRESFDLGLRGYWVDMCNVMPVYSAEDQYWGARVKTQNMIATLWAKALYEGQRSYSDERVYIMPTSMYAGIQRYCAGPWTNDVDPTFAVLHDHVVIGQQISLSGQPYWNSDIGGFEDPAEYYDPELFIRWLQWGVFCPVTRIHGKQEKEPWALGEYWRDLALDAIRLRYRLLPYIYTQAWETTKTGLSIVLPMAVSFPDDPKAAAYEHQYMFGPQILVAPVTEKGARSKRVYLPEGVWYGWESGVPLTGPTVFEADAPLDKIPLFIKAGSILPLLEGAQSAGAASFDRLSLHIYTGADGEYTLYEDDGHTYGCERGQFALTGFRYDHRAGTLTIGRREGGYGGMTGRRRILIALYGLEPGAGVRLDGGEAPVTQRWEATEGRLLVELPELDNSQALTLQLTPAPAVNPCATGERGITQWFDLEPYATSKILRIYTEGAEENRLGDLHLEVEPPAGWAIVPQDTVLSRMTGGWRRVDTFSCRAVGPDFTQSGHASIHTEGRELAGPVPLGSGWATWWTVAGIYSVEAGGFHEPFGPEREGAISPAETEGITVTTNSGFWYSGFVNLSRSFCFETFEQASERLLGGVEHKTAYAQCTVISPVEKMARLELLADDRVKVWCNGTLVAMCDENYTRPEYFRIKLREGENHILVKCSQYNVNLWKELGSRPWGFNLRLLTMDYVIDQSLTFSAK